MITKIIELKPEVSDQTYTAFCNKAEKDGVFVACGNPDDKWILVQFENKIDMVAWLTTL